MASVPLTPLDLVAGLTRNRYRELLHLRVEWMIEQADDPVHAMAELAGELQQYGLWEGPHRFEARWMAVHNLLADDPMWPDYLSLQVNSRTKNLSQSTICKRPLLRSRTRG